ncbi:peptidoglycan-binding domain-containing protein [Marinobacter caseinilyticus]|uniref:peptidoglycan-binding domain-containing protein n=1 Tax=Marinobacter caseinilyticus TaxID=2692195 RepID=UPI00140D9921|nr:peptidoglycan-binding domain-containing protein [Marinobacter caseinilyticus]
MTQLFCGKAKLAAAAILAIALSSVASTATANDTVALKNALYGAGYTIANVNGSMDAETRAALKAFQKDRSDLQASGELDNSTKKALGMVSVQLAASAAPASKAAAPAKAASTTKKEQAAAKDDVVEEDDDGGWSFF